MITTTPDVDVNCWRCNDTGFRVVFDRRNVERRMPCDCRHKLAPERRRLYKDPKLAAIADRD
jgi:hypothetical protein